MELAKDPALLKAVRQEVMTAYLTDPKKTTQKPTTIMDARTLASLPLLQSVYAELLRLHVSINITREIMAPIVVQGHCLEKGALLQAPTDIAHLDEEVWHAEGHAASEFWAARHIKDNETAATRHFAMAGGPNSFFPYGGGVSMCPGRFFAKQEIIITLAMLVAKFDVEFVEWTMADGRPSDRPARNDATRTGSVGVPPDRDMKVRLKRLW